MKINSAFNIAEYPLVQATPEQIKKEPMLFRADVPFAIINGGPLTMEFINALPQEWTRGDLLIDSRVHMLMPGMWPCIPGWHHDDVPRERADGQPQYENPSYFAEHCLALWGDCSLTEFARGVHDFAIPGIGEKVYKGLDAQVEAKCNLGLLERFQAPERRLVFFNAHTWHRGMPTTHTGFRFFIRATRHSGLKPANEIRHNANVYMPVMEEGW